MNHKLKLKRFCIFDISRKIKQKEFFGLKRETIIKINTRNLTLLDLKIKLNKKWYKLQKL